MNCCRPAQQRSVVFPDKQQQVSLADSTAKGETGTGCVATRQNESPQCPGCPRNGKRVRKCHGAPAWDHQPLVRHVASIGRARSGREGDASRLASPETGLLPRVAALNGVATICNRPSAGKQMAAFEAWPCAMPCRYRRADGRTWEFDSDVQNRIQFQAKA